MNRKINTKVLDGFARHLRADEKSENTVAKYLRDVRAFWGFVGDAAVDKAAVLAYKALLAETHEAAGANAAIAAVNAFLRFAGWEDCRIKPLKVQKKAFCSAEKELSAAEYRRLVHAAGQRGNERLSLILQTLCGTGMRVSELRFLTVEAVQKGEVTVSCKSKTRTVFLVRALQQRLLRYCRERGITAGAVFVTRSGRPMNRCNIWREMKALCAQAGVDPQKVFPHNLRHLFARTFYGIEKDLAKLADMLGHSSINTTRIYIISTGAEHRRQLERMRLVI